MANGGSKYMFLLLDIHSLRLRGLQNVHQVQPSKDWGGSPLLCDEGQGIRLPSLLRTPGVAPKHLVELTWTSMFDSVHNQPPVGEEEIERQRRSKSTCLKRFA